MAFYGHYKIKWLHPLEWMAACLYLCFFRCFSFDRASTIGGWLGRRIGMLLPVTRVARINLSLAFPQFSLEKREQIILDMWDNLGRTLAEFPHLSRLTHADITRIVPDIQGAEYIHALHEKTQPSLVLSGHYGNWELALRMAAHYGLPLSLVFRAANNPWTNRLIMGLRQAYTLKHFSKGLQQDMRGLIRVLKEGGALAMLVDQKMTTGVSLSFLGRETLVPEAPASLARQFQCPIIMARIVRKSRSARFSLEILPPLQYSTTDDKAADITHIMTHIYQILEDWITEAPEQWFWVHKRWEKSLYQKTASSNKEKL